MSESVVLKPHMKQFTHFLVPDIGFVESKDEALICLASWNGALCKTALPATHCTCGRFRLLMPDDEAARIDE
jgi:hypothetical protein